MDIKKQIAIVKLKNGEREEKSDVIVVEKLINIFINYEFYAALMCTPSNLKELAAGFLFSEDVISSIADIKTMEEKYEDRVCVVLNYELKKDYDSIKALTSGCGSGSIHLNSIEVRSFKPVASEACFSAENILSLMKDFNGKSELFKETGGVHSCAVCSGSSIVSFSEDIGRHNALDKAVGNALLSGIELKDKFLMTSGRVSSDIVVKAAKAGIPLIVSHSAPTDLAIDIAKDKNVTIIGFARGDRMNIYCNEKRIY